MKTGYKASEELQNVLSKPGRILPILFNTEMVQAILRQINPKTATRRLIKGFIPEDAVWGYTMFTPKGHISCRGTFSDGYGEKFFKLPCQTGDILYVRETWQCLRAHRYEATADIRFKAGGEGVRLKFANGNTDSIDRSDYGTFVNKWFGHNGEWRPSIHMPKEVARIWLKVTDVRVERLQEITEEQAKREGIKGYWAKPHDNDPPFIGAEGKLCFTRLEAFSQIWYSTIKKSDLDRYGWAANPWVWVIEFERCTKPEGV